MGKLKRNFIIGIMLIVAGALTHNPALIGVGVNSFSAQELGV